MNLHPFEQTANGIPYQSQHAPILFGIVRWTKPQVLVEIGTHIGAMACWIARAIQLNGTGHLTCIDNFCWVNETQEEQWHANLNSCGVRDFVTLIKGRSEEAAWPDKVDFAYIDGNHTYPVCRHDCEKARDLGATCIAMHDTVSWEGSRKYAEEIRNSIELSHCGRRGAWDDWECIEENNEGGMMILKKKFPKPPSWGEDAGEQWDVATVKAV